MQTDNPTGNCRIPYVNFPAQYAEERDAIHACVEATFGRGDFISGAAIDALEEAITRRCDVRHAVALNSGTDALILAMRALGIGAGDEVITPPNSFVASAAAIVAVGARPVFADVRTDLNIDPDAVEAAITPRTRAIMPVHLTGRIAAMDEIMAIAERHGIFVIEDAAQAFGSRYRDRPSGSFGHVGCFSAHPLKNLNAAGDAGFITTNDEDVAARVRHLRNHGLINRETVAEWGIVSRMDTLQAAFLMMRLERVDDVIRRRRRNVELYRAHLSGTRHTLPLCRSHEFNTFHTFVLQAERRDELKAFLADRQIETAIHYPTPIHLQPSAKTLGYKKGDLPVTEMLADHVLSLPVHQFLSEADVVRVAEAINAFFKD